MSVNNLGSMVVAITGENTQFDSSVDTTKNKMDGLVKSAQNMGNKLSLFVTAPLLAAGVAAVKSSANMEMLQASFEVMLGSASKATKLMGDLKDLASKTPFEVTGLAEASKTLLQFGIENEKILPTLQMLGDISGGSSAKLSSLALVFGQITSTGKLMGQDLLQLINAGFNPLQVISQKTGESMSSLKDKMSKGAISAQQVTEAFKSATSEGGRFFKGMEVASKTLEGLTSTLKDDVGALSRSFVEDLMPTIKETIKGLSGFAQWLTGLDANTKQTILIIGAFTAALGPAIIGVNTITKAIIALNAGLAINPIVAVTTALVALGAITAVVANNINNAKKEKEQLDKIFAGGSTGDLRKDLELVKKEYENINTELIRSREIYAEGNPELVKELELIKKTRLEIEMKLQGQRTGRTIQVDQNALDEKAKKLAEDKAKIENEYKSSRELILKTLEDEKTEYQKIQEEIDKLSKTPWAKGELENDRLKAIEALRKKQEQLLLDKLKQNEEAAKSEGELLKAEQDRHTAKKEAARKTQLEEIALRQSAESALNDSYLNERDLALKAIEEKKQAFIEAGVDEVEANKWATDQINKENMEMFDNILNATSEWVDTLQGLYEADAQNKLDSINLKLSEELAALDAKLLAELEVAGLKELTDAEAAQKEIDLLKAKILAETDEETKKDLQEQLAEAENALKKATILEKYEDDKLKLEKEAALEAWKIEKAAFETNKTISLIQIAIDTASAIMKGFSQLGPIPGAIAAVATAAVGIAQAAIVNSQQPPAKPKLAQGGIALPTPGGTDVTVAEAGQPEVILPLDRLNEVLNNISPNNSNDTTPFQFQFTMDSKIIFDKLFNATRNKTVLISANAIV